MGGEARRTGIYFTHASSLEHDPRVLMPGHPDTPERMLALERMLAAEAQLGWEQREAPAAEATTVELVHSARLVAEIERLASAGGGAVDADTVVGEPSYRAALHAAGGACELVRALLGGRVARSASRCCARPAITPSRIARWASACSTTSRSPRRSRSPSWRASRVFILDWDVHHGNGTAETFRTRDDVLFASIHQSPHLPRHRPARATSALGRGEGYTLNLPVAGRLGRGPVAVARRARRAPGWRAHSRPISCSSRPASTRTRADPLAGCRLSELVRRARAPCARLRARVRRAARRCPRGRL